MSTSSLPQALAILSHLTQSELLSLQETVAQKVKAGERLLQHGIGDVKIIDKIVFVWYKNSLPNELSNLIFDYQRIPIEYQSEIKFEKGLCVDIKVTGNRGVKYWTTGVICAVNKEKGVLIHINDNSCTQWVKFNDPNITAPRTHESTKLVMNIYN